VSPRIDGLVSTLDTTGIVSSLLAVERRPQQLLKVAQDRERSRVNAFRTITRQVAALQSAVRRLHTGAGWDVWNATSSAPEAVQASAGSGAMSAQFSFTVDRIATAHSMISSNSVASQDTTITSSDLLLARNPDALGFTFLRANSGLQRGSHTISVTQPSAAAHKVASNALATLTSITAGVNDTLEVSVNGVAQTLTIAAGSYDASALAAAIGTASGGSLVASIDTNGALQIDTARHGSAATLQVTGGTSLTDLRLEIDSVALTGIDAVINVDGTETTLTSLDAGNLVTLTSGSGGSITAALSGGVRAGTITATSIPTGNGSLAAVVSNINAAKAGISAAIVQTAPGQYRLQLTSASTGSTGALGLDPDAFPSLGTLHTLTAAQDAVLTVGSGTNAFTITSASNTLTTLLPGVTLTLRSTSTSPVNISVERDADALANKVQAIVDATNALLGEIDAQSAYNPSTRTAAPLAGDFTIRRLATSLATAVTSAVTTSPLGSPGLAGVTIGRDGRVSFDRAKFTSAYAADPAAVETLFRQGATTTSDRVAFASATARTQAGTYPVAVTRAAEQAEARGDLVPGGTLTNEETIDVRVAATTVTYVAAAGESLTSIATAMNTRFAEAGMRLAASVEHGALVLRSLDFGSAANFDIRTSLVGTGQTGLAGSALTWETKVGVDVAGSIGGAVAQGSGQLLQVPSEHHTLGGLALRVTASPDDVALSNDFGTVTYSPGVAARLDSLTTSAIDSVTGSITTSVQRLEGTLGRISAQISDWDRRLSRREQMLRAQFVAMESLLARLQSQNQRLTNAIASLRGVTSQQ
jgi:flagellar hook-associated protein 2